MTRHPILVFAWLTIVEAARRRLLWALVAMTIGSVLLTTWGVGQLLSRRDVDSTTAAEIAVGISQVLVFVAFMFSFVLAMTAAFLAAPSVAGEIESGILLTMLARPVRRADLLLGRWLGLAVVVVLYAVGSGLLEIGAIGVVSGYSPPDPFGGVAWLAIQAVVLMSFTVLLSTRASAMASGAVSIVAFGLAWMFGVLAGVGRFFDVPALGRAAELSRVLLPTDLVWHSTVYALQPPAFVLLATGRAGAAFRANPFYSDQPPSLGDEALVAAWLVIVLALAVLSLRRRAL